VPGVLQIAGLAGPCEVIARAQAQDIGALARQLTCRVNAPRRDTGDELSCCPLTRNWALTGARQRTLAREVGEGS